MRVPKQLGTIAIAAAVAGVVSFGAGAVVEASATGSSATYQACLSSKGALSKVSATVTPTCPSTSSVINWNQQGPQGNVGPQGLIGPAGPTGATLNTCTTPPGPNLNYSDCDLRGVNFSYSNLTGANLSGARLNSAPNGMYPIPANLQSANLSGANLTGAYLGEANLSGVTWANTTCPDGTNSSIYSPQTCIGHGI